MPLITDISDQTWRELSQPSDIAISTVAFWFRANLGQLNVKIGTTYSIDSTNQEITPELGIMESAIFKKLYSIYYYTKVIRENMGAASFSAFTEISSDGASVRRTAKTEVAKLYTQLRSQESNELERLVNAYKTGNFDPAVVYGDDTSQIPPGVENLART